VNEVPGRPGHGVRSSPRLSSQGQPVTIRPAQRGHSPPVRDPARGIDAPEPVDHLRPIRRAGQRHRSARSRLSLPEMATADAEDNGATGRALLAASRTAGGCAGPGAGTAVTARSEAPARPAGPPPAATGHRAARGRAARPSRPASNRLTAARGGAPGSAREHGRGADTCAAGQHELRPRQPDQRASPAVRSRPAARHDLIARPGRR